MYFAFKRMRTGCFSVILICFGMLIPLHLLSQTQESAMKKNQKPVVAGRFYDANPTALKSQLAQFYAKAAPAKQQHVIAVIAPHAGYVFSGQIAADAYNQIDPEMQYKRVFVIASSHQMQCDGASVYTVGNYETPLGEIVVDTALCQKLINENSVFRFVPEAHSREHSLEVQLPFLQVHLKHNFLLVPVIIATQRVEDVKKIAAALQPYFTDENLFVISSDFSHYPAYADAKKVDSETADAICSGNPESLVSVIQEHEKSGIKNLSTDICGWTSALTLMYLTQNKGFTYHKISYANSGDSPYGDTARVVGYHAIAVSRNKSGFSLSDDEKTALLIIARQTLVARLERNETFVPDSSALGSNLFAQCGMFVSLHKNGDLRGCIGRFGSDIPLYKLAGEMALAAAFQDSRFNQLTREELSAIDIEISVLTPMVPIKDTSEIILGKHGIYIRSGRRSGTFLPQVATQTHWTKEEFLGHCSRDKAGLGWDGWKNAELFIYEAIVFDESLLQPQAPGPLRHDLYESLPDGRIRCLLCPHQCTLNDGQTGACRARKAVGGNMVSLSYGKLAAVHIDPVEKKPLYHFQPGSQTFSIGTAGCNLHCKNCQNHHISQVSPDSAEFVEASPAQLVDKAVKSGCTSISYTYNEPTVFFEFMLETAKLAHEHGLRNIMVSNGYISPEALQMLIPYLDAANIDLKSFNDSTYRRLCSASLEPVLETLQTLRKAGVWLEITHLIIPGYTDDEAETQSMCRWLFENGFAETPLHFSRFFPAYQLTQVEATSVEVVLHAVEIAKEAGIQYVYAGNLHQVSQTTQCHQCGELIIERKSYQITPKDNFNGICPACGAAIPGVW